MTETLVGVFGSSRKPHEKRVPIHPAHLSSIDASIRKRLLFEQGYGVPFGISDAELTAQSGGVAPLGELYAQSDIAILAKPLPEDFAAMKEGVVHWGWPHCVQQTAMTQTAVDRKQTLIAWEAMHEWSSSGAWQRHVFYRNNEIAGYAAVQHALNLVGTDGNFGPSLKAAVIGYGSVSQGAVRALRSRGVEEMTVYLPTGVAAHVEPMDGLAIQKFHRADDGSARLAESPGFLADALREANIIVNGILQDTDCPIMFLTNQQVPQMRPRALIVDVSCDAGMGFEFARPTSYAQPMFDVGQLRYYAVDHTPSYLWDSASWEISRALLPYLPILLQGPDGWNAHETIRRAIEIQDGVIQNPKILSFQHRQANYPHAMHTA